MQLTEKTQVKPILKWAGNKAGTPVAARVKELFEPYRMSHWWVEPFLGVGGMLLEINPDWALCCDASAEVVGLHQWVQDGGKCVEFPEVWSEQDYYQRRSRFVALQLDGQPSLDLIEDWDEFFSLMIWLNKACFNGLWRVNAKGFFNVSVGKNSKGALFTVATPDLKPLHEAYKPGWNFGCCGFELALHQVEKSDIPCFTYADPPYWGTHSAYTAGAFNWDDQVKLAERLSKLNGPTVASNSNHPDILALYQSLGFEIELIEVRRSISCDDNRKPVTEMLAHKGCAS